MDSRELMERATSFSLASMVSAYPDAEFIAAFEIVRPVLAELSGAQGMLALLREQKQDYGALCAHYLDLFESGKERVSLYETEYGRMRGAGKGVGLADIAGFYGAFGMSVDGEEMIDHIGVELEFYALLLAKLAYLTDRCDTEGCAIVLDAMRKFLAAHLATFVGALAARIGQRAEGVYGPLFEWIARLVHDECERLGVRAEPLDYFEDAEREREARCARSLPVIH